MCFVVDAILIEVLVFQTDVSIKKPFLLGAAKHRSKYISNSYVYKLIIQRHVSYQNRRS